MKNLKAARDKRNVTQIGLSTNVMITQETISAYESGKAMPSAQTLVKIADFLNTSTDYLLGRIDKDVSLKQLMNEEIDEQMNRLINNYAMLNDEQKKDLIWYSDVLRSKEHK